MCVCLGLLRLLTDTNDLCRCFHSHKPHDDVSEHLFRPSVYLTTLISLLSVI